MKFLIDHQLPRSLKAALFHMGCTAIHISDAGLEDSTDSQVWEFAQSASFVVITKDVDFCHLARRPGETGQVVWVRTGNTPVTALTATVTRR